MIDAIQMETFRGLASVKQLLLQENRIEHIEPGSFDGIFLQTTFNPRANPRLMLVLSHNSISTILKDTFQGKGFCAISLYIQWNLSFAVTLLSNSLLSQSENVVACFILCLVLNHPAGRVLTSDWSLNSSIMKGTDEKFSMRIFFSRALDRKF